MADDVLNLKDDKSEQLLIGNPKRVLKIHNLQLLVGDNAVKTSAYANERGIYYDSTLSFKRFANKTAATVIYHIQTLAAICDHLP